MPLILEDSFTKRLVLEFMIQKLEDGGVDALLKGGATPALLDTLRSRPARDVIRVAEMIQTEIQISFDPTSILGSFQRLDLMKRSQRLQEYFILHGASQEMMASLFKSPPSEVRALRERLRPDNHLCGRPPGPNLEEREDIWQCWRELSRNEPDARERYYRLHQRFNHMALSVLWTTVHEAERVKRRQAPSSVINRISHSA